MKITTIASHTDMPPGPHFVYQTPDPYDAARRHRLLGRGQAQEVIVCGSGYCLIVAGKQPADDGKVLD